MATKDMIIDELLNLHEGVAAILLRSGMHCVGCPSSRGETLEEAALVHGIDADKVIDEINTLIA